jgi:hypothetical protein
MAAKQIDTKNGGQAATCLPQARTQLSNKTPKRKNNQEDKPSTGEKNNSILWHVP